MDSSILIVEDDPQTVRLTSHALKSLRFNTYSAFDLSSTINVLKNKELELVIIDYHLTDENGDEICKYLKSKDAYKNIPILMISGEPDSTVRYKCLDAGADEFMSKPFTLNVLLSVINKLINSKLAPVTNQLSSAQ